MKITTFLKRVFFATVMVSSLAACSDDDHNDEIPNLPESPKVFILNEGTYQGNNANVSLYLTESDSLIDDLFYKTNKIRLGDTGQDRKSVV